MRLTRWKRLAFPRKILFVGTVPKRVGLISLGVLAAIYFLCGVTLQSSNIPTLATPRFLGGSPLAKLVSMFDATTPVLLYSDVKEDELLWFYIPPVELGELRASISANKLIAAFRTTIPHPFLGEMENVHVGARYLAGTILEPGAYFSLNRALGPRTRGRGYTDGPMYSGGAVASALGGGICKLASALYNVVILSGLPVLERHPHSMPVPYVPPGRDATIARQKDFRFQNNTELPILIWATVQENTLYMAFYGRQNPPQITWLHEELSRQRHYVIRQADRTLPKGEEQVVMEGLDGVRVHTWVLVKYPGVEEKRLDLGIDSYRPLPGLIRYGR